jgi:hypothetical protein
VSFLFVIAVKLVAIMVSSTGVGILVGLVAIAFVICGCGSGDKFASPRTDFLASRWPSTGLYPTASGPQATPFHIYAADFFAIWADIELKAANQFLEGTEFVAIRTKNNRAIAGFWQVHVDSLLLSYHVIHMRLVIIFYFSFGIDSIIIQIQQPVRIMK